MGGLGTGGMGLGGVTALIFGTSIWSPTSPPTPSPYTAVQVTAAGQMFSHWDVDADEANCTFWNGSYYYAPSACDPFAVSRISPMMASAAVDRAIRCGAQHDTACVLSGEIGFSAPAAFVYDETEGFRMMLAPRILPTEGSVSKIVRLQDPAAEAANVIMHFNSTITIEYMSGGSRSVKTETLNGTEAYCVQALRASILPACWTTLD